VVSPKSRYGTVCICRGRTWDGGCDLGEDSVLGFCSLKILCDENQGWSKVVSIARSFFAVKSGNSTIKYNFDSANTNIEKIVVP
jgi:hypothetical protein